MFVHPVGWKWEELCVLVSQPGHWRCLIGWHWPAQPSLGQSLGCSTALILCRKLVEIGWKCRLSILLMVIIQVMWHIFESASGDSSSCDENAGPGREGHIQKAAVSAQSIFATWCCLGHNTRFRSMLGSTRWCIFYLLCKVFWHPFVSFIYSLVCLFVCLLFPSSLKHVEASSL